MGCDIKERLSGIGQFFFPQTVGRIMQGSDPMRNENCGRTNRLRLPHIRCRCRFTEIVSILKSYEPTYMHKQSRQLQAIQQQLCCLIFSKRALNHVEFYIQTVLERKMS